MAVIWGSTFFGLIGPERHEPPRGRWFWWTQRWKGEKNVEEKAPPKWNSHYFMTWCRNDKEIHVFLHFCFHVQWTKGDWFWRRNSLPVTWPSWPNPQQIGKEVSIEILQKIIGKIDRSPIFWFLMSPPNGHGAWPRFVWDSGLPGWVSLPGVRFSGSLAIDPFCF